MTITPKQFNQLATKENLKKLEEKLKDGLASKYDLKELEEKLKDGLASKKDMNKVLNSVDGLAKRFDVIETEFKADKLAHDRIQKQIDNLELKTSP